MAQKAKTNTALVYNPSRSLTGAKTTTRRNPVKKAVAKRTNNPVKKVVNASSNRKRRRRSNPDTVIGTFGAALMVGIGVTIFDVLTNRFTPQGSPYWRIGVKFGGAWAAHSLMGQNTPIIGKYRKEIALVLAVSGVVDLLKWLVVPSVESFTGGLLGGGNQVMQAIPAEELGDDEYYYVEEVEEDDEDEY